MKLMILIVCIILLIVTIGCKNNVNNVCKVDSDCKSISGCIADCFNKDDLPSQTKKTNPDEEQFCGMPGPVECSCVDNICVDTGLNELQTECDNLVCVSKTAAYIKNDEQAVFPIKIVNNNATTQTYYIEIIPLMGQDEQGEAIKNDLDITLENNNVTLNSKGTLKQLLKVKSTIMTSKGIYPIDLRIDNQEKSISRIKRFYVKVD